ncbi:sialoadhesin-like [Megalobrama amblycephala]|uniref:sialoadhesin-like n=1 Tax=Megalobrama amblycephala TaxID=75352 RepID=UPI0020142D5C|nr:sialoadhesin-like [Megalobrama amblycephala]
MAPPLPLIFLIMIHGVSSADWGVSYSPSHICALKNSSVIMNCTYTYPTGHQITKTFWTKTLVKYNGEYPDLSEDPEYSQRLQYLGDKQQNCTIRLSHVTLMDSHEYYFRFITDKDKWTGIPGVTLTVTDLQVESPERVTEGDSVRLTCKSSCNLTDRATFIWYRNSQPLTERRDRNNELLLQSVRREDAGRYSCAVHGHNHISPAVQINVTYPPRNVSVLITGSGEIVSGDSVTLICSSDSNPPAEISWFKGGTFVGSGRIYNISKISSDDSGEYKCRSINEHGEKYSDAVTLNVMYPPRNVSVLITGSSEIVSGDSVTLICNSDSNPPAEISWFKGGTFVGTGRIYSISKISSDDSGEYKCRSINEHGEKHSDAVTLNVMYPPKSVSVSISPSGEIVSGDSVTLICSSDSNPPAEISWFKGGKFVGSGRIFSISKISSDDSGEYKCRSINEHGEKYSDAVTLNVMYPPKSVSVSISPSGEIVSGDSVTLNCSSDSNPPPEISWFKGGTFVGSGRIYSISKISSDDSGEYKCRSINEHGEKYSDTVTLNVMYPPRNVSVSIIQSGQIWAGDSVTLICSSDSNPPALNFSWFKENESSAVGSGQSFSALQSGRFYCQAHNQHGSQRSDAVTVTDGFDSGHSTNLSVAIVIVVICAVLFLVCIIMFIRKRKCAGVLDLKKKQVKQPFSADRNHSDDGLYARVSPRRTRTDLTAGKTESTDSQKISYATIQHTRNNEDNYENLRMDHPDPDVRSGGVKVIYSTVK